jgi:hypothetical protein
VVVVHRELAFLVSVFGWSRIGFAFLFFCFFVFMVASNSRIHGTIPRIPALAQFRVLCIFFIKKKKTSELWDDKIVISKIQMMQWAASCHPIAASVLHSGTCGYRPGGGNKFSEKQWSGRVRHPLVFYCEPNINYSANFPDPEL